MQQVIQPELRPKHLQTLNKDDMRGRPGDKCWGNRDNHEKPDSDEESGQFHVVLVLERCIGDRFYEFSHKERGSDNRRWG